MPTVFERKALALESEFELDITWNRSRAYTVDYEAYNRLFDRTKEHQQNDEQDGRGHNTKYLIVDSYCEIEEFDRISESAPVTRPRILVMLSMICFATGNPITPFGFFTSFTHVAHPEANV